jgi:hypothetical protein
MGCLVSKSDSLLIINDSTNNDINENNINNDRTSSLSIRSSISSFVFNPSLYFTNRNYVEDLEMEDFGINILYDCIPKSNWTIKKSDRYLYKLILRNNNKLYNMPTISHSFKYLSILILSDNNLQGNVDWYTISMLRNLVTLDLSMNNFTGEILWNVLFPKLNILKNLLLSNCLFEGLLPDQHHYDILSKQLLYLDIRGNKLHGKLYSQLILFMQLRNSKRKHFDFSDNDGFYFDDNELNNLSVNSNIIIKEMNLSNCSLINEISKSLSSFVNLNTLNLSWNNLNGEIPDLSLIINLTNLDLSHNLLTSNYNNLTTLQKLPLISLNLSTNNIDCEISFYNKLNYKTLLYLDISWNKFNGNFYFCNLHYTLIDLNISGNDIKGKKNK